MTIERLNQYRHLVREIKQLTDAINKLHNPTLHDSVLASDGPGNTQREISVYGSAGGKSKLERRYNRRIKKLEREREAIEAFLDTVDDSYMRQLIWLRVVEIRDDSRPLSWANVAERLGYDGDGSTQRKQFEGFF